MYLEFKLECLVETISAAYLFFYIMLFPSEENAELQYWKVQLKKSPAVPLSGRWLLTMERRAKQEGLLGLPSLLTCS